MSALRRLCAAYAGAPWHRDRDRGDSAVGFVIAAPVFVLFLALVIMAGRLALAHGTLESAASEAARAASLERSGPAADRAASRAAITTLSNSRAECLRTSVHTSRTATTVTVTVVCEVDVDGLGLPIPGSRTLRATGTSVIDTFRGNR